jgi:type IV pilus assembly protein PilY1
MKFSKFFIVTVTLSALIFSNSAIADDLDAFKQLAKSNAMILMDTSGSMSWPVYNPDIDYAAFMKWMIDNGYAYDDEEARGTAWWGVNYDRLDPKGIYLVKSDIGHRLIDYVDSEGNAQQKSALGDVMSKTSSSANDRDDWIERAIIPCKNAAGNLWNVDDDSSIDVVVDDGKNYAAFPAGPAGSMTNLINGAAVTVDADVQGQLKNSQNVELHKLHVDPMTNQVFDYGLLGFLSSSGYYFSGVFERNTAGINFTASHSNWDANSVYIFATGNWINFIKLVEDFILADAYSSCRKNWTYDFQRYVAWKYICYKPGETEAWTTTSVTINSHDTMKSDYSDTNIYDMRGVIIPPVQAKQLQIRFQFVDTDYESSSKGRNNDFVEIKPDSGPSITIAGDDVGPNTSAFVSTASGAAGTWTTISNYLDSQGYTPSMDASKVTIYFNNGSVKEQPGADRGFKIIGYRWTSAAPDDAGDYSCCNGIDGYGYKIKSRMDVAKTAMINAVELTQDTINWGLTKFNSGTGATLLAALGTSPTTVVSQLENLEAGGSTPLGEALQDTYKFDHTYLANNPEAAKCSANFVLTVTDGYPSDDGSWSRISGVTFDKCTTGYGTCGSTYGDADVWPDSSGSLNNYMDDVAHWMYNKATYKHTVHAIAFGLDNPMLGDVADSSNGIYITAYNEEQLMNAFYSLGLSMTNAISFAAPAISVDEENRAQAGDELYMAFFRPVRTDYWQGNLKRFKISWNATEETVVDQFGSEVTDTDGSFKSASRSFWSTENDGGQINKGGAGGVLLDKVSTNFSLGNYFDRMLYTYQNGTLTSFTKANMEPSDFGVSTEEEEAKIINFMYGYAFNADSSLEPTAVRNWILGDIIHSEPLVIDYVDNSPQRVLTNRYIAIGSNHGILHVFDTTNGQELFGFIPPALLTSLQNFGQISDTHYYGVDGQISKFQTGRNPSLMVFGLRRGGRAYYALDISSTATSMWNLAWAITSDMPDFSELGQTWSKVYFSNLPQTDGTYRDVGVFTGGYDPAEDSNSTSFLPQGNSQGRGIFVVDASDGSLVFKCTYGTTNSTSDPTAFTRTDMKHSFPADPRVVRLPDGHKDGDLVIYAVDVASQLWKMLYDKDASPQWQVHRIFNSNGPTNTEGGADVDSGFSAKLKLENMGFDSATLLDSTDIGRKNFSQPDVSYAGDCSTDNPVIYFGTGDRENPLNTTVSHRFYAVYDMSTNNTNSLYYNRVLNEADMLNVSDVSSNSSNPTQYLGDDYNSTAQGWYVQFDQQNDAYDHTGEKLTSSPRLFNKIIFFSTYKPTFDDICAPNGDSFLYAIKYCSGMPAYDWVDSLGKPTRYQLHKNSPLASSWRIMAKEGVAAGKISVGSKLINIPIEIPSGLNLIWWDYN